MACPHPTVVMGFALGEETAPDVAADVAVHIEDCEECAGLFRDIAGDDVADDDGEPEVPPGVPPEDAGSECPSAAELAAYHAGELTPAADARVIKHLSAGCEPCTEAVLKLSERGVETDL